MRYDPLKAAEMTLNIVYVIAFFELCTGYSFPYDSLKDDVSNLKASLPSVSEVARMRKPTGSRALLIKQLKEVISDVIPRLESLDQADQLELEIERCRKAGMFDDTTCYLWTQMIATVRKDLEVQHG